MLGERVRRLIYQYHPKNEFFTADVCYVDARKYLPVLLKKRGVSGEAGNRVLDELEKLVKPMELGVYQTMKQQALSRIANRDPDDWPVLASAIFLQCPIWTEDNDFFGTGVPTWTSDKVELFLASE